MANSLTEEIVHNGVLIALIVRDGYSTPGVTFFTPKDLSQQLAYMKHPAGTTIEPHSHNPILRSITGTLETLVIKRGRIRVDLFDKDKKYLQSRELSSGDVMVLVSGGHGFEVLEELEMIEVKQGPYVADQDKTRFVGKIRLASNS